MISITFQPSLMPGGSPAAWPHLKPIFQGIAAKAPDGEPCCEWVNELFNFPKIIFSNLGW